MANGSTSAVNHGQCLPKTASRCIAESVTAAHDFEVINYPLLNGMGVGKFVTSSTFSVGGYEWNIRFYPDGQNKDCAGNASAFFGYLIPAAKDVRAKFTLNVLEKEGQVQVTNFSSLEHTFSGISHNLGYLKFIDKSKLKSCSDRNNGCFIIRCVLTVIQEPHTVKKSLIMVPQPNLQEQLEHMWKDGEGTDVTFSVSGQVFNAHRCLLAARSPVFKAELFGPMKEKATQCIKIDDIESPIFEALLHFIYTDSMPEDDDDYKEGETAKLQHLLVVADRYGVERLKIICESKLCDNIDVETVATTLVLAEQHHCKDLREATIEFMASRNILGAVMATDGFKHLVASCPHLMKDILGKVSQGD